MNEIAAEHPLL